MLTDRERKLLNNVEPIWRRRGDDLHLLLAVEEHDVVNHVTICGSRAAWDGVVSYARRTETLFSGIERLQPSYVEYFGTTVDVQPLVDELDAVDDWSDPPEEAREFRIDGVYLKVHLWHLRLQDDLEVSWNLGEKHSPRYFATNSVAVPDIERRLAAPARRRKKPS